MMLNNLFFINLHSPGAIAFSFGDVSIRWYGVLIALGFLLAYFVSEKLIKINNLSLNYFSDIVFLMLIFGIIFARLWFVALSWDYFKHDLGEIPKIWHGGQSIHGAILGGILSIIVYCKIKKINFYSYADVFAVSLPLAQSIGRWGNFFNNEAFGKPTDNFFIKSYIPIENRPVEYFTNEYFHPTFLYESIFDFIIFVFLFKKYKIWKEDRGFTFWLYLILYSSVRFLIEFIRVDSLNIFGNISSAHFISVVIILISIVNVIKIKHKGCKYEKN